VRCVTPAPRMGKVHGVPRGTQGPGVGRAAGEGWGCGWGCGMGWGEDENGAPALSATRGHNALATKTSLSTKHFLQK
jgi:hypothetical protein